MEQYRENAKTNGRGRDVCNIDTCEESHDTLIRKKLAHMKSERQGFLSKTTRNFI